MKQRDQKKVVTTAHTETRNFSYSKGTTTLRFNLRTDIKQELKDFKELMLMALSDIDIELSKQDIPS